MLIAFLSQLHPLSIEAAVHVIENAKQSRDRMTIFLTRLDTHLQQQKRKASLSRSGITSTTEGPASSNTFDGEWEGRGIIDGATLRWWSGRTSQITVSNSSTFSVELHGATYRAELDPARGRLLWNDGDVWTSPNSKQTQQHKN